MEANPEIPLAEKLGFKANDRIIIINEPIYYHDLFRELPVGISFTYSHAEKADIVHWFTDTLDGFIPAVHSISRLIKSEGSLWISWPTKTSGIKTDVAENIIREAILPLGLVGVARCAVDVNWSAVKLVWRTENC